MAVTDQQILADIQRLFIETVDNGATWSSGLWSTAEVEGYTNQRQDRFLKETCLLLKRDTINLSLNTTRYDLFDDWISTQDASFRNAAGTVIKELRRSDQFEVDQRLPTWQTTSASRPLVYNETDTPSLQIEVMPAPDANGNFLDLIYVYLGATLAHSGVALTVPDDFAQTIIWGTIADMLSKIGRAQDLERATYAEMRYQEGIEAAKLMLSGWA